MFCRTTLGALFAELCFTWKVRGRMVALRVKGDYHEGDVRRYGVNSQQQAIDHLLHSWAVWTWNLKSIKGKEFSQKVAENLQALEDVGWGTRDPQADWKRSANGKERRARTTEKPDWVLEQVDKLAWELVLLDSKQFALLCLHYGALKYRRQWDLPTEKKAAELGLSESAYRSRLSKLRRYFIDWWPEGKMLEVYEPPKK